MGQEGMWGWCPEENKWVKLRVDDDGSIHVVGYVDSLDDIGDVELAGIADNDILVWDAGAGDWVPIAMWTAAHKNSHDPIDGSDKLDTAAPVKVAAANVIGSSHSFSRADHVHEREHAKYTDADAVDAIEADGNLPLASITFIIDGGGEAIAIGEKGHLRIPFACTLNRVTMLADQDGAIVVDIWKWDYANFPPTNTQTITSATPPTIAATGKKSEDSTLSSWTVAIAADDILAFNVDSCATIQRVTISLKVTKT